MQNTHTMKKNKHSLAIKTVILFFILAFSILTNRTQAMAASSEYIELTGEYQKAGNIQAKVSFYTIYVKIGGKEYSYSVTPKYGVSAVTNGSEIYYKLALHDELYQWDPLSGTSIQVATLTCGTDSAWIRGGYGDELFLVYEHPYTVYRFSLTTQKTTLVKKHALIIGQYGQNLFLESNDNSGENKKQTLYRYNALTQKVTTLSKKEFGYTISGKWLYYAKITKTSKSSKNPYTLTIYAYNMTTGKTKTLAKGVRTWNRTTKITKKYVNVYRNGTYTAYKYKYSTKKYTQTDNAY